MKHVFQCGLRLLGLTVYALPHYPWRHSRSYYCSPSWQRKHFNTYYSKRVDARVCHPRALLKNAVLLFVQRLITCPGPGLAATAGENRASCRQLNIQINSDKMHTNPLGMDRDSATWMASPISEPQLSPWTGENGRGTCSLMLSVVFVPLATTNSSSWRSCCDFWKHKHTNGWLQPEGATKSMIWEH